MFEKVKALNNNSQKPIRENSCGFVGGKFYVGFEVNFN
jgi:hypothetical protein